MFHHLTGNILLYTLQLLYGLQQVESCFTPFMAFAEKMNLTDCTPIVELIEKYGENMPPAEAKFIRESFWKDDKKIVCCDLKMNVTETFQHVGTAQLRNYAKICGDNVHKRLSFAEETTFMSYPWSALLVYEAADRFQCGASLITNQYVITAAHCIKHTYPLVGVRLREHNITSEVDCVTDMGGFPICLASVIDIGIEKTIVHPDYSTTTYKNDIGLIRLKRPIIFERSVRPICLPEYENQEFDKLYGTVTGWGATEKGHQSEVLLEADIPIRNISYCQQIYRRSRFDHTTICAGGQNAIDVCKGDSGGPLILRIDGHYETTKNRYMQSGIISLGARACGDKNDYPAIFTKISTYMSWIADNIEFY